MARKQITQRTKVIDGKGHILGRLASVVAKQLLLGNKVVVVRCEELTQTGKLVRNRTKFAHFLHKVHITNHQRGPLHFRAPSRQFWRVVRGMLPYKTARGKIALSRFEACDGIPPAYNRTTKTVVPAALRAARVNPERDFTVLGELAASVGWHYQANVSQLEEARKKANADWHAKKLAKLKLFAQAKKSVA